MNIAHLLSQVIWKVEYDLFNTSPTVQAIIICLSFLSMESSSTVKIAQKQAAQIPSHEHLKNGQQ